MKKQVLLLLAAFITTIAAYASAPTITSFSPASGPVGTLVTITGTNLGSPTAFTIGGVSAIIVSNTGTTLVGMVMPGTVTGTVSVMTSGGNATATGSYTVTATAHPSVQQGDKLVGTGADTAWQGYSVAISADGNTAIVGGYKDNNHAGAAWVYSRSGTTWAQQGLKLVGTGAINGSGGAEQGYSVSISADGSTAIVGGFGDNNDTGAAWIYTRSGTTWTQQGSKLVGTGAIGAAKQGTSVALSADGNTVIIGAPYDNGQQGAAWVYTRTDTTWTQQGNKLVGTGGTPLAYQGSSVALSANGNTAIVGAPRNNSLAGGVWIYTRSGTTWSQQGAVIEGTGVTGGAADQGASVSLSADGNTAIVGGVSDHSNTGAAWIFTRSGATWTQQGNKLVGTGYIGPTVLQGFSVSLSADGNTAIVGGVSDNNSVGAAWVYTRTDTTWTQQGGKLIGTGAINGSLYGAGQGGSVSLSADGRTAVVGGPYDNSNAGAAWIFGLSCSPDSSTTYDTLSSGVFPYHWNGLTFTSAGIQTAHLTGSAGCDSSATLVLTIKPTGISEISGLSPIHLYPNPNTGSFTLQTSQMHNAAYTISDMIGQTINQETITSDTQIIDMGAVPTGIYMLSISGTSEIVKFAVMR